MGNLLTYEDCNKNSNGYYEGKIIVLSTDNFLPEFQNAKYQLFKAQSGFGCSPITSGNAIYGYFIEDGEKCRVERYQVIGEFIEQDEEKAKEMVK